MECVLCRDWSSFVSPLHIAKQCCPIEHQFGFMVSRSVVSCLEAPCRGSLDSTRSFGLKHLFIQTRNQRYRPFVKPIRGPVKIAKRGGKKDALVAEQLEKSGLQNIHSTGSPSGSTDALNITRQSEEQAQRLKQMVSVTPFQGMRYIQAFHPDPSSAAEIRLTTRLAIDLSREAVRGVCQLPNGLQTKTKLLVFCRDDEAEEMKSLGADFAGLTAPIKKIQQGWTGFDRCIATPTTMKDVLKVFILLHLQRNNWSRVIFRGRVFESARIML